MTQFNYNATGIQEFLFCRPFHRFITIYIQLYIQTRERLHKVVYKVVYKSRILIICGELFKTSNEQLFK